MDKFTEGLLERTRARSENLAKKMNQTSPRKRRAPLADANAVEKTEKKVHFEASPAKPSLQTCDIKPDTPAIPSVKSRMSKLADMRKEWSATDGTEMDSPQNVTAPRTREPELELTSGHGFAGPSARKSRFAALAASINSWEDDLDHPKHQFQQEEKPQTRKWVRPQPEEEPSSDSPKPTEDVASSQHAGPKKPARNVRFEEEEEESKGTMGNGVGKAQIRSIPGTSLAKESASSATDRERAKPEAKAELRSLPTGSPAKQSAHSRLTQQRQEAIKPDSSASKSASSRKRIQVSMSREREVSREDFQKHLTQEQLQQQPTPKPRAAATSTTTTTTQPEKKSSPTKRLAPQPTASAKKQAVGPATKDEPAKASNVKAYFGRHRVGAAASQAASANGDKVQPRVGAMAKSIQDRLRQHQENWHCNDINKKIQEQRKKELDIIKQRWNHSSANDEEKPEKEEPAPAPRVTIERRNPDAPADSEDDEDQGDLDPMEVTEDTINTGMVESPLESDSSFEADPPPRREAVCEEATPVVEKAASPLPPPREKQTTASAAPAAQEEGPATPHAPPRLRRSNVKLLAEEEAKAQEEVVTPSAQQGPSEEEEEEDDDECEEDEEDDDDVQELNITDVFGDIDDLLNEAEQAMDEEASASPVLPPSKKELETQQTPVQKPPTGQPARPGPSTSLSPNLYSIESFRKQGPKSPLPTKSIIRSDSGTVGAGHGVKPMALKPISLKEQIQTLIEEVSAQQSIIYQTSQALNLIATNAEYRGSRQEVEAERLLLIAAQRRQACLAEIQRLKTPALSREPSIRQSSDGEAMKPCKGFVTIQDIRLPLKTEYMLSNKDRMNHYFFLLLRCREHVLATRIQTTAEEISGDCLSFTNTAKFNNLDSDFVIELFVFEMQNKRPKSEDKGKPNFFSGLTPKKLLASISKESRHGFRTPTNPSPGGPGSMRSSNFNLVGASRLTLQSCRVKRFTLCKVPFNSPLEGTVHLNMSCHTNSNSNVKESGWLTMFDDISGFGAWHRRWCVLGGGYISYWKYPDDEKRKAPNGTVDLRQCITNQVAPISRILCARPNTFELVTQQSNAKASRQGKDTLVTKHENSNVLTKFMLSADVKEDRIRWIDALNKTLLDLRTWNREAARPSSY